MARPEKVDWAEIKTEYVTGNIGYRSLAEKHGVSFDTLAKRAKREAWAEAKDKHKHDVAIKATQRVENELAKTKADNIIRLQRSADKMVEVVEKVFEDVDQFHRHIVVEKRGFDQTSEEKQFEKLDTKAMRDVTAMLRDLTSVVRDLYGLPTVQEKSAMDIAAERLKLEQRKVEQADKDANEGIEIVLVGDELEEYSK